MSPAAYARSVQTICGEAARAGRDLTGFEWMLYLYTSIRADGDQARAEVGNFLGRAYGDHPDGMLDRIAPAGTPDEIVHRLQEYVDAGVRHFIVSPATRGDTLEVITLAANEVLPTLGAPSRSELRVALASTGLPLHGPIGCRTCRGVQRARAGYGRRCAGDAPVGSRC